MDITLWVALITTSLGTFLMRAVPLLWMQHHLARQSQDNKNGRVPMLLSILGPLTVGAMLGVSLVPKTISSTSLLATFLGTGLTLFVWYRTKSLAWSVVSGVSIYGVTKMITNTAL
ncbi:MULTISPECIES: AzlD domain-containing protein [unclassified Marinobacter]|uniref:AzlD domain-containing protein n=1 Tax=unclassified Marinobacter TaxID=83889 RepID=UPI0026E43E5D|nr:MULTISPECIES: AzlD domain-containing protein [unclassified Marinobacter]MDO6443436.1 AzlD domain-containing protein [Marinobacter sp. 2_MG-2023]MDO6824172.1 AzlD domain-containing protein [Marinobacter sp. 1_MG-2023]